MESAIIETPRLYLRPLTAEKWTDILLNRPADEAMSYLGLSDAAQLERDREKARGGFCSFNKKLLIFHLLEKETGAVIGWCGYHTWYIEHDRAEIGYGLNDDRHKRQGLMTEALAAILDYGFDVMGLHRIEGLTATYNEPSKKLLLNFGFMYEGTLREHYLVDGKYEDSMVFGLVAGKK